MEGADVEHFLSGKRKRGEAVLTKDHLKELITNQLSFTLQRVFGDEGKKVISVGTGTGTAFSRGRVEPPELAAA
jgi:hypothetical protein